MHCAKFRVEQPHNRIAPYGCKKKSAYPLIWSCRSDSMTARREISRDLQSRLHLTLRHVGATRRGAISYVCCPNPEFLTEAGGRGRPRGSPVRDPIGPAGRPARSPRAGPKPPFELAGDERGSSPSCAGRAVVNAVKSFA